MANCSLEGVEPSRTSEEARGSDAKSKDGDRLVKGFGGVRSVPKRLALEAAFITGSRLKTVAAGGATCAFFSARASAADGFKGGKGLSIFASFSESRLSVDVPVLIAFSSEMVGSSTMEALREARFTIRSTGTCCTSEIELFATKDENTCGFDDSAGPISCSGSTIASASGDGGVGGKTGSSLLNRLSCSSIRISTTGAISISSLIDITSAIASVRKCFGASNRSSRRSPVTAVSPDDAEMTELPPAETGRKFDGMSNAGCMRA